MHATSPRSEARATSWATIRASVPRRRCVGRTLTPETAFTATRPPPGIVSCVGNVRSVPTITSPSPLQGRQVTSLLMMIGAAVNTGSPNSRSFGGAVNVSVAGGLPFGVAYLLDGAMHNDAQNNANLPLPFPDVLQESNYIGWSREEIGFNHGPCKVGIFGATFEGRKSMKKLSLAALAAMLSLGVAAPALAQAITPEKGKKS